MRCVAARALLATVLVALCAWAGAIGYTVQVAALSDADAALQVSRTLLRDGFPAYVVRAEGGAGAVFRVRVGAFADRSLAERYALRMGRRAGGTPQPALAESIPSGILPMAPERAFFVPAGAPAALHAWGDGWALERKAEAGPSRYRVAGSEDAFEAWWAAFDDGGTAAVVPWPVVPPEEREDPPEVREAIARQRVGLLAERAELPRGAVQDAVREATPWSASPYLVVHRRTDAEGRITVLGVARAGVDPEARTPAAWIGAAPPPATPPAWRPGAVQSTVTGDGWRAEADDGYTRLETEETAWRALAGRPVWAAEDALVVEVDDGFEVVLLAPR